MTESLSAKELLRQNLKTRRSQVDRVTAEISSIALWKQFKELSVFQNAQRIAAFVPNQHEIDIFPILEGVLSLKKELYLPKSDPAQSLLQFHPLLDLTNLVRGPFNILEPPATAALPSEKLDLILVPGLAFDPQGHRLGYGQGYYDRFLTLIGPRCFSIGIGYSFQMVDQIPSTAHDIPLKALLTEKSFVLCS